MSVAARGFVLGLAACRSLAEDQGLPSDFTAVHANVVLRHGERSRLVKSTAAEFGVNDGVTVRHGVGGRGCGGGGGRGGASFFWSKDDILLTHHNNKNTYK